jgi:hypothetical protein
VKSADSPAAQGIPPNRVKGLLDCRAFPLLSSVNQPIEQTGVERSVSDALGGPKVQAEFRGQTEWACGTMADEEEAATAAVPLEATEIIVELGPD